MPFDPDAYLGTPPAGSEKPVAPPAAPAEAKPGFDPDAFLAAPAPEAEEKEAPTKLESLGRGLKQGMTMGWGDEITAALESAFTDKTYAQSVAEARAADEAARKENPWTFGIGEVGGGIATGLATGGAGAAAKLGLTGAKAAAALGAAGGAISGAGAGEGLEDSAKKALVGAGAGAALGAAANKIFGVAAEGAAAKAAGTTRKAVKAAGDTAAEEYAWAGPEAAAAGRRAAESAALTPKAGDLAKEVRPALEAGKAALGTALLGPKYAALKIAGEAGKAGTKAATEALASLVRGAKAGDLTKTAVLNALDQGVPAATVQGVIAGAKNVGPWAKEFLGSDDDSTE